MDNMVILCLVLPKYNEEFEIHISPLRQLHAKYKLSSQNHIDHAGRFFVLFKFTVHFLVGSKMTSIF